MSEAIILLQIFGWCILLAALGFAALVWLIHSKGRQSPWVRAVGASEIVYVSREDGTDWHKVLADALTDGLCVDEIVLRYGGAPRISLGIQVAELGGDWNLLSHDSNDHGIRVTVPGDEWQQSLAASRVLDTENTGVPESFKDLVGGIEGVTARWDAAVVRLRAPQVVIDVPAELPVGMRISPRWVEALRMKDSTSLYVLAATVAAIGAVLTLTGIGIAAGVVVFVALSGVCKFIFMSRRSDPTREEYLQNY